ncbi:MAG: hypothetical protein V1754_04965 [Pseudomonadota bacterium]
MARNILQGTAKSDTFTGAVPNNEWGYGKVDMTAALASICTANEDCFGAMICCGGACVSAACELGTCDDGNCVNRSSCSCLSVGAGCSSNSECCSNKCVGKPGRKTCK